MTVGTGGVDACVMDLAEPSGIHLFEGEYPGSKVSVDDMEFVGSDAELRVDHDDEHAKWELPYAIFSASLLGSGYSGVGRSSSTHIEDVTYGVGKIAAEKIINALEKIAKYIGAYGGDMNVKHYEAAKEVAVEALSGLINVRKMFVKVRQFLAIVKAVMSIAGIGKACNHYSVVKGVENHRYELAPYGVKIYPVRVVAYVAKEGVSSEGKEVKGYDDAGEVIKKVNGKKYFFFDEVYVNGKQDFVSIA